MWHCHEAKLKDSKSNYISANKKRKFEIIVSNFSNVTLIKSGADA